MLTQAIHPIPYLNGLQNALPKNMELFYCNCLVNEKIIGVAIIQKFRFRAAAFNEPNPFKSFFLNCVLGIVPCHLSLFGSLFCIALPGFVFDRSMSEDEKAKALAILCKQKGSSINILKDINSPIANILKVQPNWQILNMDNTMELKINAQWNTFDDYLFALEHKYRQRANKNLALINDVEIRHLSLNELSEYKIEIYQLYLNVLQKQKFRLGKIEINYFENFKKEMKEDFFVEGYFLENKLIAFSSGFLLKNRIEIHYIGIDYKINKTKNLYFNILFNSIKLAIQKKVGTLELGRTAQDAKAVVGARPQYFTDALFFKNFFFSKLFNFLFKRYNNNNDTKSPQRNPFKKEKIIE